MKRLSSTSFPASTFGAAPINIATGLDPTSPVNGDLWVNGSSMAVKLGGVAYELGPRDHVDFWAGDPTDGSLSVFTGSSRWYADYDIVFFLARASVGVAPTGASLIVDMNVNGTTIYGTQSNRPTIVASAFTDTTANSDMSVITMSAGDYMTVDVDQVGSTIPGSHLQVSLWYAPIA